MKEEKKESPIGILWGWGKPYHGKFIGSIALAVLGVACQMVPYFCVAHIVTLMLSGDQNFSHYTAACVIALCGYLGKVIFSNLSTTISHTATYYTLRDLRENITAKLARVPMGTILDTPSGQYKTTIVDRVEGMEPTFAHLIPEMTANVLVPLVIVVYLFVMDWRMALLSLVTLVVGLAVMSAGMKSYPVKWEGAVKAGKQMANAIVEYIGGMRSCWKPAPSTGICGRRTSARKTRCKGVLSDVWNIEKNLCFCRQQKGASKKIPVILIPVRAVFSHAVCRPLCSDRRAGI